jgi:hypothetical protein
MIIPTAGIRPTFDKKPLDGRKAEVKKKKAWEVQERDGQDIARTFVEQPQAGRASLSMQDFPAIVAAPQQRNEPQASRNERATTPGVEAHPKCNEKRKKGGW